MVLDRFYRVVLEDHFRENRQMAFVAGPRQVGKSTTCGAFASEDANLSWDDQDDRALILAGPAEVARRARIGRLRDAPVTVVFDELHKYGRWKTFLKGFFDTYGRRARVIVTGSSRLDVYRRGGDSLMGRYFLYRMHPLSVGELLHVELASGARAPSRIDEGAFEALWQHGGFPEPYLRRDTRFSNRWNDLRLRQLVREDVRDLTRIREIDQIETLVHLLAGRSPMQISYSSLAQEVRVSVDTMRRWIDALCSLHHGFLVRPWFRNVARSLRKEPKWYGYDWSRIQDPGARAETFIACQLYKAVQGWTDLGLGRHELRHLRDKDRREVDFVVIRDAKPWFLVEVKLAERELSPHLGYFQRQTGAPHAFQVVVQEPFVAADCFEEREPCVVPARTFLSQLL